MNCFSLCRIVRLTSPNLNYCVIVGAILIYGSVFVVIPVSGSLAVWNVVCKVLHNDYMMINNYSILSFNFRWKLLSIVLDTP